MTHLSLYPEFMLLFIDLKALAITSKTMVNRSDTRHSCLVSEFSGNNSIFLPLNRIQKVSGPNRLLN